MKLPPLPAVHPLARQVRAAQRGDRRALGELFDAHADALLRVVVRIVRNHAEAQEIVQETFLKAMLKLGQLESPERFSGWIRAIATRLALNHVTRSKMTYSCHLEAIRGDAPSWESPERQAIDREEAVEVRSGLRRLNSRDRETLEAFYVHGRSLREMSEEFSAPLGTIKRRLHDARKRLSRAVGAGSTGTIPSGA